ncbi:porin family protein [Luteolibacter arcticus]|uniref:Porin family protein n=1 Tax=Luteolibacter arcticus TaxID=1581411 RepID=A0ABT3GDQ6_9BACT|nr:porin family protein [Luteolibacter arcticus]MCW1921751.1 porin family protein [Luteolibacter arcticus]
MKYHTLLATTLALAVPSGLQAGEAETTTTQSYQAPMTTTQHQGWYLGGGVDYMVDSEEPFYNAHLGYDFGNGSSLFLESGWLGQEQEPSFLLPFVSADVDIVPITLNYKYEYMFTDAFGLYVGAGLGASSVDVSAGLVSDDEWVFTAQAFAGLVYNVTPNFEIYAGARYLWMDDISLFGANIDDLDDVGVGAGIRFNF